MPTTRRDFIGSIAATGMLAALPGSLPISTPIPLRDSERAGVRGDGNSNSTARIDDEKWDLTWVDRLRGKSRAVFDSPNVGEGGAIFRAILWREQHEKVFGTPRAELTPVVVIRHVAIPLVMNDEFWDHLGIGKDVKWKDEQSGKWTKRNPLSGSATGGPAEFKDYNIPAFIGSGGIVLACNLAFGEIIQQYVEKDKVAHDEAETRAKAHLLPGVILQPSGFFAVLKAQDEGCKYMLGS
ncbi:MAG TPA: hypothetical protein VGN65_00680 [Casimicrobiaceae bacterium]|jgi:hypothetical protein